MTQQPERNTGLTFLGMSGGILALVIAGVIFVCIGLPVVLCLVGAIASPFVDVPTPTPTWVPPPTPTPLTTP